ncbi:uncharacterized protein B0T15DRAFT_553729 [Chaetomium strumarium]|uniref:AB hydrolase-1 domain-containing protein n=1 Tax=Chaetomium strumarium TaxID=1170767 RepID=A0AAJ0M325_9PEZI|nr:hypothetical protein B0T15DRAFT_553729 [Chaetomium strumarium]
MATLGPSAEDFLNDARFHRTFTLPADPSHGRPRPFTIKYADYGYHNNNHNTAHPEEEEEEQEKAERVLLFFSPLMGSRLLHICKDALARRHRIRIINPDRPGIGGTDAAPAGDRLALWRDALPALLAHLHIRHLHAVAAHSGGTVYALDFVLHHPEFLLLPPPSGPGPGIGPSQQRLATTVLALGAPWILPAHSGSLPLSLAQNLLPAAAVRQADKLAAFVNNHLGPAVGSSIGFAARLMPNRRQQQPQQCQEQGQDGANLDDERALGGRRPEQRGVVVDDGVRFEEKIVWPALMRRVYDEGVAGLGEDAVLFLQKAQGARAGTGAGDGTGAGPPGGWGDWGDYDTLVVRLREVIRREGRRLRVRVYYAEKDVVVRDGGTESDGARWFDKCWTEGAGSGDAERDVIDYRSRTVDGADHDHVWDLRWGVVQEVFADVGQVAEEGSGSG